VKFSKVSDSDWKKLDQAVSDRYIAYTDSKFRDFFHPFVEFPGYLHQFSHY